MAVDFDLILRGVGAFVLVIAIWRALLSIHRRLIRKPKAPESYGKWAIVTGSTSGIGAEYADYLAKRGMAVMIISRTESKLQDQAAELKKLGVDVKYLAYDYTDTGPAREKFYNDLDKECAIMDKDGGIGLLVNNVGTTNQYPQSLLEISDELANAMINCNVHSTVFMTKAVMKYMRPKDKGAILNVSSGSGLVCSPYIAEYSATKAFITQFSRSLHVENLDTGIDVLVVMPLYVVSNLFRTGKGDIFWPLPIKLVEGSFCQLGKKMVYQGHGYWMHGLISNAAQWNPFAIRNTLSRMNAHRAKYQKKLEKQAAEKAATSKKD